MSAAEDEHITLVFVGHYSNCCFTYTHCKKQQNMENYITMRMDFIVIINVTCRLKIKKVFLLQNIKRWRLYTTMRETVAQVVITITSPYALTPAFSHLASVALTPTLSHPSYPRSNWMLCRSDWRRGLRKRSSHRI